MLTISWALRQTLKNGYPWAYFKADLSAAFVVSLIALPLSMALAIAIGLPPQHGIYTAIVAGIAAAIFGGSQFQISGPTAAFVVILIPIVNQYGLDGLIWCQILAGLFLLVFSVARLGKFIHAIPYPVIIGFTSAIALVLARISCKDFFGEYQETFVGMVTLLLTLASGRMIVGMIGATVLGFLLTQQGFSVATLGTEFNGIPSTLPTFHFPTLPALSELTVLCFPAFTIAILAALESLLSAKIADKMTNTQHHANGELSGIGIANILSGLATGIPATAAIARTAANIQNGAKSPFAAIFHALFMLLYILLLAPLILWIPISALAALLILTAYNMSHWREFKKILFSAPLAEKLVLMTCFLLTVSFDMVIGITTSLLLSTSLYIFTRIRKNYT